MEFYMTNKVSANNLYNNVNGNGTLVGAQQIRDFNNADQPLAAAGFETGSDYERLQNAVLLNQISYREAIELAFYGASVIHPKTLQPLQKKEIPLFVKSFINPTLPGTSVSKGADLEPHTPCFIVKKNQLLLSLSSIDFDFIMENHISEIFALFAKFKVKVNLIQNTAISFSVCIEDKYNNFEELRKVLAKKFKISYNENVSLYTIRHFDENASKVVETNKTILLRQISRETMQVITKE
jgi:aspartate kinase